MDRQSPDNGDWSGDGDTVSPYDDERETTAFVSLERAIGYGLLAGVGTYGAVVAFLALHVYVLPESTIVGVGVQTFVTGTFGDFFGTHLGTTSGVVLGGAGAGTVPVELYYLAPILSLGVCGRRCAETTTPETDEVAFLNGAAIALGYALVVVLFLWLIYTTVRAPLLGFDPYRAALIAGVVYPLVLGGLGGLSTRFSD